MFESISFILFCSFLLNLFFIKILVSKAKIFNLIDIPDKRKLHSKSTPIVAGLSMFFTFIFFFFYLYDNLLIIFINKYQVVIFLFSTIVIFLVGIIDDAIKVSTLKKIFIQVLLSVFVIYNFQFYKDINFFNVDSYLVNYTILIIFILVILNSINLIDGIDNLAGIICSVISIAFIFIISLLGHNSLIFYVIIGCLCSYLIYNNFISKVFIGDSGSLFLGWIFSIFSLLYIKHYNEFTIHIPILILSVPIFDMICVIIVRLNKMKNIFLPDHYHIHYLLQKNGFNNFNICFLLFILSIIFSIISFLIFNYIDDYNYKSYAVIFMFLLYCLIRSKLSKSL